MSVSVFSRAGVVLGVLLFAGVTASPAAVAASGELPDLTGVWENLSGVLIDGIRPRGESAEYRKKALDAFVPVDPPYKGEYAERWKEIKASFARGEPVNDPTASCVWPGVPRVIWNPYPQQIVVSEGGKRVTFLYEYLSQVRRAYLDGRGHPDPDELDPSYNGHTIGHWEGQTLVLDTVGLRDDTMLQNTGMMHSDQMQVQERYHLVEPDLLQADITLIDPVMFDHPITTYRLYRRHRDWSILDYVCEENNRELVVDGVTQHVSAEGD